MEVVKKCQWNFGSENTEGSEDKPDINCGLQIVDFGLKIEQLKKLFHLLVSEDKL